MFKTYSNWCKFKYYLENMSPIEIFKVNRAYWRRYMSEQNLFRFTVNDCEYNNFDIFCYFESNLSPALTSKKWVSIMVERMGNCVRYVGIYSKCLSTSKIPHYLKSYFEAFVWIFIWQWHENSHSKKYDTITISFKFVFYRFF